MTRNPSSEERNLEDEEVQQCDLSIGGPVNPSSEERNLEDEEVQQCDLSIGGPVNPISLSTVGIEEDECAGIEEDECAGVEEDECAGVGDSCAGIDDNPRWEVEVGDDHQAILPDYNPCTPPKTYKTELLEVSPIISSSIGCRPKSKIFHVVIRSKARFVSPIPKGPRRIRVAHNLDWGNWKVNLCNRRNPVCIVTLDPPTNRENHSDVFKKWCSSLPLSEEELVQMYKLHWNDDFLHATQGSVDGTEFKVLLFIPHHENRSDIAETDCFHLYINRVLSAITVKDMLPTYLGFLKGIINVESLPVTAPEQKKLLKAVKKQLVSKALNMFYQIVKDAAKKGGEGCHDFWTQFGNFIKLGIIEDSINRFRLSKLLRFQSSHSHGKFVSFDSYFKKMRPDQLSVFYTTDAEHVKQLEKSPHSSVEVMFFTGPLDMFLINYLCRVGYRFAKST